LSIQSKTETVKSSDVFEEAFQKVIELEGGFVLHKNPTEKYQTYAGIYRGAHPEWEGWKYIDRGELPPTSLVRKFYYQNYWEPVDYPEIPDRVKVLMFLSGVNIGTKFAIKIAQKILGLVPDGIIGSKTLTAFRSLTEETIYVFLKSFTLALIKFYTSLSNKNPKKYSLYLRGWLNRAFEQLEFVENV